MLFFIRLLKRIFFFLITFLVVWFIVKQIYTRFDEQIKILFFTFLFYILAAYIFLPPIIQTFLKIMKRKHIPSVTTARDGISADPINIVLYGTEQELVNTFEKINWYRADSLNLKTVLKMLRSFVLNKPYPQAPFSSLYLFGRKQDIGFEEPIGNSPRQRHHVRFWKLNPDIAGDKMAWIGAATKDIGFGFANLTYQLSHKIDFNIDRERDYLFNNLKRLNLITDIQEINSHQNFFIKKYISDGVIVIGHLQEEVTS